jgi:hypothetical protein
MAVKNVGGDMSSAEIGETNKRQAQAIMDANRVHLRRKENKE